MNIGGSQANDAFLRVPVQGRILTDAGPVAPVDRSAAPGDGPVGAQRSDSLRTVSGNRIDPPRTGGPIGRPSEGAPGMDTDAMAEAFSALLREFAGMRAEARHDSR